MKKVILLLLTTLLLLTACGGEENRESAELPLATEVAEVVQPEPTNTAVPEPTAEPKSTDTTVPEPTNTAIPEPTVEPTEEPALTVSGEDLVGIWLGTVAGERGYIMYTADGQYSLALSQDALTTAPRVSGEYWIEDGQLHIRDLENAGHWAVCEAENIGIYEIIVMDDGKLDFETVDDPCNTGGFTRNYIFANMTQEWLAEPVSMEGSGANPELAAALQAIADTWVNDYGVPSFILMVDAPDMDFTWKGAAGLADPEADVPAIADDQFIISSGTKMYTAVAIMKLVEEGALNLDDPISLYLPEEYVSRIAVINEVSYGEEITVRQLLNHTSGLGDFSNGTDENENGIPDFKELVLSEPETLWDETLVIEWAIANVPPVAPPEEMFNYSDTNYQLLGMIIENVAGMTLSDAYRQMIFEPLGMTHTYFEFHEEVVPGVDGRPVSHMYYNGTLWNELDSHSYEYGSGGLVSTVEDQNRFLWAWATGELFDDPATKEAMMVWEETADVGAYYGLGVWNFVLDEWDVSELGTLQGHGGLPNSHAHYWPEQNITIIGTLNSNEPPLGFIGVMIEVMFTVMAFSGG